MKNSELRNLVVNFLATEHKKLQLPDYERPYPAKFVADAVGGYAGAIGKVATQIVSDLWAMGIRCSYDSTTTPKRFMLRGKKAR